MACSGSVGTGGMMEPGVGTVVNNPSTPASLTIDSFARPFEDIVKVAPGYGVDGMLDFHNKTDDKSKKTMSKHGIVAQNSLLSVKKEYKLFEAFTKALGDALGDRPITDEVQSIEIFPPEDEAQAYIIDILSIVDVVKEPGYVPSEPGYHAVRLYLKDKLYGKIYGTYILEVDDKGLLKRGDFLYYPPPYASKRANGETPTKGLTAMAFDFSGEVYSFIARKEVYNKKLEAYIIVDDRIECNSETLRCVSEHTDVRSPSREFGTANMRFSWDDQASSYCISQMLYADGEKVMSTPATLIQDEVEGEKVVSCTLPTPSWDVYVIEEADLFLGYADTDPVGGSANTYIGDGLSTDNANLITLDTVNQWLHEFVY